MYLGLGALYVPRPFVDVVTNMGLCCTLRASSMTKIICKAPLGHIPAARHDIFIGWSPHNGKQGSPPDCLACNMSTVHSSANHQQEKCTRKSSPDNPHFLFPSMFSTLIYKRENFKCTVHFAIWDRFSVPAMNVDIYIWQGFMWDM